MAASEKRSEYIVQLISGVNMDFYPGNVISEFTTILSPPLVLPGNWDVALVNCAFHNNWLNIIEPDEALIKIEIGSWAGGFNMDVLKKLQGHLPHPGNYSNIEMLIEYLNSLELEEEQSGGSYKIGYTCGDFVKFEYNKASQTVTVKIDDTINDEKTLQSLVEYILKEKTTDLLDYWADFLEPRLPAARLGKYDIIKITFSETLANMLGHRINNENGERELSLQLYKSYPKKDLGLDEERADVKQRTWYQFNAPVFSNSLNNLFIYSDFVESSRLGDADAEYICTIPVTSRPGQYEQYSPPKLIFRRVKKQRIETIRVKIGDLQSQRVRFNSGSGEISIVLLFKRRVG